VGREGDITQIVAPDPSIGFGAPILNDAGTVAFQRSFTDETMQQSVEDIVTIDADGTLTVVADTRGEFAFYGFRPPSLDDDGDVAFLATLDDFSTTGIFVQSDPIADRVIATGDMLEGSTVQSITFCEERLSDTGELPFVAQLEPPVRRRAYARPSSALRRRCTEGSVRCFWNHSWSRGRGGVEAGTHRAGAQQPRPFCYSSFTKFPQGRMSDVSGFLP
jgi:hypothetical protein